ncbi:hypothetical protein FRC08_005536, partial [Ceratobasidium sp. 394]
CQYVWYCSTSCQGHDRPAHSELCPLLAGQPIDNPIPQDGHHPSAPSDGVHVPARGSAPLAIQHVRAFVLPANRDAYYDPLIELHASLGPTGDMRWIPQLEPLLGPNASHTSAIIIKGASGQILRFPLQLFFQAQPDVVAQADKNQCAHAITDGASRPWQGNLIVLKFNGARRRGYRDIEDSDLPSIRHFLIHHQ